MGTPKQNPMAWKYCGDQIKRWRAKAGVTREQLAQAACYDVESVRSMEAGRRRPSLKLLQAADELCDAKGMLVAAHPYLAPEPMPTRTDALFDVEKEAVAYYFYEPLYIPGLLQTEAYARAILSNPMPPVKNAVIEERLAIRLKRQERLAQPEVLFSFTIYEAAFHTSIGGREVMKEQLHRLLEVEHSRNIQIQVVPTGRISPSGLGGSLMILETIDNEQYAYVETHKTNALHSEPRLVGELSRCHAMIRALALTVPESAQLIRKTLELL
ncbi:helix-turn-helix protein [Streptomyces sp. 1114.5]|nr:helix-turn-helix transcriptional regulator [Streptomyces sp. 1114.5]RKT15831.1 helix-turn-helix protein [Streptomyces sp. 1114.5]SOB82005.1 Helix-turn-helix domain-containing protein [Streptomyces sp. 1331.2]